MKKYYTILVADDQPSNLETILNFFEESNEPYSVLQAIHGEMACMIARKKQPDLIIMDWEMPVMNGIDAIKKLKNDKQTRDIPVIMASGVMVSSEHLKTALDAGAVDYIRKPIDKVELIARVRSMLELSDSYKEIKALNYQKDKMFSIIAHDLRGPIGNFRSMLEVLITNQETLNREYINDVLEDIKETAGSTFSLLENLLLWARSQMQDIDYELDVFDMNDVIVENLMLLNESAKNKSIELINDLQHGIHVYADRNMTSTVIRNLISNAIKFTHTNGKIIISSGQNITDKKMASFSVSDNGIGISEQSLKEIFAKKTGPIESGTNNEKGSGLGLMLCKEFIEQQGGTITVESKKGKGSIFTFTLPLHSIKCTDKQDTEQQQQNELDSKNVAQKQDRRIKRKYKIDEATYQKLVAIKKEIQSILIPEYRKIRNSNQISEIQIFAENVKNFGKMYGIKDIEDIGEASVKAAKSFDVEKIEDIFANLNDLLTFNCEISS